MFNCYQKRVKKKSQRKLTDKDETMENEALLAKLEEQLADEINKEAGNTAIAHIEEMPQSLIDGDFLDKLVELGYSDDYDTMLDMMGIIETLK